MKAVIGKRLLADLAPRAKPFEIRDTKLSGFLVRVQPSGVMSYVCEYRRGKRVTIGRTELLTPIQARDRAKAILLGANQGKGPVKDETTKKEHTLETFLDEEYGPWYRGRRKRGGAELKRLKRNFPDFLPSPLPKITLWNVEKWRTARLQNGIKPITLNRDLAPLKTALSRAVDWGFLTESPLARLKPLSVDRSPLVRYLSDDEERRLRKALIEREHKLKRARASANRRRQQRGNRVKPELTVCYFADHLQPMVLLSLNTGLRKGELGALKWLDVDLDNRTIVVRGDDSKSGQTRVVPLNDEARAVLTHWRAQPRRQEELVFPGLRLGTPMDVKNSWTNLRKKAKLRDFRWHDLRHTFASKLAMRGVDLNTIRELLGHASLAMTLRYAHLAPEHKMEAVSKLDGGYHGEISNQSRSIS